MIARRSAALVVTFLLITFFTFALSRLAPGDPYVSDEAPTASAIASFRELRALDAPLLRQYARWLSATVRFDFGRSFIDARLVSERVGEALQTTLILAGIAALLTYVLAVPLGVLLALKRDSRIAIVVNSVLFTLHGVPVFWGGLLLGLVASKAGLPTRGMPSLVLALICLVYPGLARIARYQRAAVLDVAGKDYVRLARAKGLPERLVVQRYIVRPAITAPLTLLAAELPWLLGGSVVVERIFTIPGMGMLTFDAILRRDIPVIMGVTAVVAMVSLASSVITDIAQRWADPRLS